MEYFIDHQATQCIPLRGHRDYGEFPLDRSTTAYKGNLRAILPTKI